MAHKTYDKLWVGPKYYNTDCKVLLCICRFSVNILCIKYEKIMFVSISPRSMLANGECQSKNITRHRVSCFSLYSCVDRFLRSFRC